MSGEILFLAHRLPFPPDRGDKIRSHHILRALARLSPVHVGTFADSAADWAQEGELAALAASHCLVERRKRLPLAGIEALVSRAPVSLTAFGNARLARYVEAVLKNRPIETIYVFSGQMGQYVPPGFAGRLVVDLVDVDSAKFEAYAQTARWPLSLVHAREGRLLACEEARLAALADHTLLVSEAEAALLRSRLPAGTPAKVAALGNGIDAQSFDPGAVAPAPELAKAPGPHLLFTGQMDYAPNIAAAERMIDAILPRVRRAVPQATFHVVGRNPPASLQARDGEPGVRVWGGVPDMRPFLAATDLVVVPLSIARGVQNKVLEAMAMARPVVLTSGAATGIAAEAGRHFAVADDDAAISGQIVALLGDTARAGAMGQAARQFVLDHQSWSAMLAELPVLVGCEPGAEAPRHAA